jgi:hypothetical protein
MYLDRQFQRKSFSGPRFGHSASSFVVARHCLAPPDRLLHSQQTKPTPSEYAPGRRISHFVAHRRYITDATAIKA